MFFCFCFWLSLYKDNIFVVVVFILGLWGEIDEYFKGGKKGKNGKS